jgi:hypothetical protein
MISDRFFINNYLRGDAEPIPLVITKSDGSAMDWTGYTWAFVGRTSIPAGSVADDTGATFAKANASITLSALTGSRITFTIAMAKTDTSTLNVNADGYVDVECELQGTLTSAPITVAKGTVRLLGDVARA